MITPIEIQNTVLKSGMGYNKKETDTFISTILKDYETLYKENMELKDKLSVLSEGIQYYKNMETTLQKALVLAEKTSEQTHANALKNAAAIEKEADAKAKLMLADAKNELIKIEAQTGSLIQEFEKFKALYKSMITSQLDLLDSECFRIKPMDYSDSEVFSDDNHVPTNVVEPEPQPVNPSEDDITIHNEAKPEVHVEAYTEEEIEVPINVATDDKTEDFQPKSDKYKEVDDFEFLDD